MLVQTRDGKLSADLRQTSQMRLPISVYGPITALVMGLFRRLADQISCITLHMLIGTHYGGSVKALNNIKQFDSSPKYRTWTHVFVTQN